MKRFHYTRRKCIVFLVQNVLPLIFILLALVIAHVLQTVPDPPKLELHPSMFLKTTDYNYIFVGGYENNRTSPFIESLYQPCGVGAHLLGSSFDPNSRCFNDPAADYSCHHHRPSHHYHCSCNPSCLDWVPFPDVAPSCWDGTVTGSRLQDLTTPYNSSDPYFAFDTLTTYLLRTKQSFIEKRYGGLSFGHKRDEIDPYVDWLYSNDVNSTLPFLATYSAAKVWYTYKGFHAMPSFLNVMNNALMRGNLPNDKDPTQYGESKYYIM